MSDVDPTPEELAAAERTDAEIDAVLRGEAAPGTDPTLLWLSAAMRTDPPASLHDRIRAAREAELDRLARPARWAAAALAYLFLSHGFGNFFIGGWVADNLDQPESPHALTEGSLALMAVGIAVAAGAIRRRWLTTSAVAGVPLGVAFGFVGLSEAPTFGAGAALHLSQAAAAVAFGYLFWKFRDATGGSDEEGASDEGSDP